MQEQKDLRVHLDVQVPLEVLADQVLKEKGAILDTPDQLAVMDNLEESVYRVLLAPLVSLDKMEQKEILDLLVKKASRGLKDL